MNLVLQIRSSIIYSIERERLTSAKVQRWRKLVHLIRMQANFAGDWQKSRQIMLIIGAIIQATGLTFMILTSSFDVPNGGFFVFMQSSYVLLFAGRICLKIYAANTIDHEESMIARELIFAKIPEAQFSIQFEVKFLHDMINQKPCLIKFGSYGTLSKSLILGIGSQVVSYISGLMQFFQTQS
ncbi:unnamed protein product [Allacma fusca]|uniref:Uncharacterized protein n=1 Tax=Allacma fusca TaxID=39272 RepID=A0A8J2JCR0_9HEXA|nr:unnamed protein product [Allacma fusca]